MTELVLEVRGLTAGYGGAPVLRGLDLDVAAGEVVAVLGPNGAGKTTMMRAISNVLRPARGSVRFLGVGNGATPPHVLARRGLGHVPEGRGVFFGLTVAEHLRLRHRGEKPIDSRNVYRFFPALEALRDRPAGQLSGGEQQMLALARALAREPRLLLVDELSLGLAPVIVQRLLPVVRRYASEAGAGVIIVEQHVELALDIADRGYVLAHGEVVLARPATELRHDRQLLAASYLGGPAR